MTMLPPIFLPSDHLSHPLSDVAGPNSYTRPMKYVWFLSCMACCDLPSQPASIVTGGFWRCLIHSSFFLSSSGLCFYHVVV